MDAKLYERAQQLVSDSLELPADQQRSFLSEHCGGDEELHSAALQLLELIASDDGSFEEQAVGRNVRAAVEAAEAADDDVPTRLGPPCGEGETSRDGLGVFWRSMVESAEAAEHAIPERIGNYEITRLIGTGGMGVVYEARQQNPDRRVAIKVLQPGMAGPFMRARFQREVELLGRLRHPGIARVLEAGEDRPWGDEGALRPFLVLEYVDGVRITDAARRLELDIEGRLALLATVCDAVEHAHRNGIVHRDLKPDNVLVDEEGRPHVLDFGVARKLEPDATRLTMTSHVIGTLSYMSPEQMQGKPETVGPPADVYALGVMTYELLTGRLPHLLGGLPLPEAIRTVLEEEPARLGTAHPELSGDIEAVVGKALEKEPQRRYSSAAAFADDLRRILAHEPILARRPSTFYRVSRFVRRNRGLSALAGSLLVVLLAGVAVSTDFALRERGARKTAERAAQRAQLAAAVAELQQGRVPDLSEVPEAGPAWRWAWQALRARMDDSLARLQLETGLRRSPSERLRALTDGHLLVREEDRLVVVRATDATLERVREVPGTAWQVSPDGQRVLWRDAEETWWLGASQDPARDALGLGALEQAWFAGSDRILTRQAERMSILDLAGREITRLPPHEGGVLLSADGGRLVVRRDGAAWGLSAPFDAEPVKLHRLGVLGTFSEDGGVLVAIDEDGRLRCFETARWTPCAWDPVELDVLTDTAPAVSVAAGRIVVADWAGYLDLHDLATGERVARVRQHSVATVRFSPDGRWIVPMTIGEGLRFLASRDGRQAHAPLGHRGRIADVTWLPDGRVASLDERGWLRLFAPPEAPLARRLEGHGAFVYGVDVAPDSRRIASAAWDHALRTWDAWTGRPQREMRHDGQVVSDVRFSPDGQRLYTVGEDGVREWNADSGEPLRSASTGSTLSGLAVVGESLVTVGHEDGALEWTGDWSAPRRHLGPEGVALEGVVLPIGDDLRFLSSDGSVVWLQDRRDSAIAWRQIADGRLAVGPEGLRWVAVGDTIELRSTATGRLLRSFERPGDGAASVAFHPTEPILATGDWDGGVRLWDLDSGELVVRIQEHARYVKDLCFSPDGSFLVSASGDGTLFIHDTVPRSERLAALRGED